jgi:hypothetical protein
MEGMDTAGESVRKIPITFPESWDSPPQFAGMSMDAKVTLKELFEFDLAPESDEFAGARIPGAPISYREAARASWSCASGAPLAMVCDDDALLRRDCV